MSSTGSPAFAPRLTAPIPWVSGVEYSGPASLASSVAVAMTIPDDFPAASDMYYVALSVFDGAESYDQVGFSNDNGSWQVYYGTASVCDSRPDSHWAATGLNRDTSYTFEISIDGGGVILFEALSPTGVVFWQETAHTGATYLDLESTQTCGTTVLSGFTETEEVYAASLGNPPYNFAFANATENGDPESQWTNLTGSNTTTLVVHHGSNATIFNEPFTVGFASSRDSVTLEAAASSQVLRTSVSVAMEVAGVTVGVSAYTTAASWTFSSAPATDNASFSSVVNIGLPPSISPGTYIVEIEASDAAGLSNRVALVITALAGLSLAVPTVPSSGELDANETATLSPTATGGSPAYTYSWSNLPKGCTVAGPALASCRLASAGTYSVLVGVSDTLGYALYHNATLLIAPDPVLSLSAGPASLALGDTLSVLTNLTGGLAPFDLFWQNLPPGCGTVNSTSLTCHPSTTGRYAVTVSLMDRTGFRTFLTVPVDITTTGANASVDLGMVGLILVASGLVVLIAMCTVLLARRHRGP